MMNIVQPYRLGINDNIHATNHARIHNLNGFSSSLNGPLYLILCFVSERNEREDSYRKIEGMIIHVNLVTTYKDNDNVHPTCFKILHREFKGTLQPENGLLYSQSYITLVTDYMKRKV